MLSAPPMAHDHAPAKSSMSTSFLKRMWAPALEEKITSGLNEVCEGPGCVLTEVCEGPVCVLAEVCEGPGCVLAEVCEGPGCVLAEVCEGPRCVPGQKILGQRKRQNEGLTGLARTLRAGPDSQGWPGGLFTSHHHH